MLMMDRANRWDFKLVWPCSKDYVNSNSNSTFHLGAAAIEDRLEDVSKLEKSRKANFQLLSYIFVSFKSYLCPVSKIS